MTGCRILMGKEPRMTATERVTMREAAGLLGVSHAKMWQLVKDGLLPTEPNPLDRREKLIRVADIEHLKEERRTPPRPWPRTVGAADLGIQSEESEAWLEAHWRPC